MKQIVIHENVPYKGNYLDGIVQRIQNVTKKEDIVENNFIDIITYSRRQDSSDPKAIFGINNNDYAKYWCTENHKPESIILSFKYHFWYSLLIEGIGFIFNTKDLFKIYTIETSMDSMNWESSASFDSTSYDIKIYENGKQRWENYVPLPNLKSARFLRITPSEPYGEYAKTVNNFVIYGLELFGKIILSSICTKKYLNFSHFIKYEFFVLISI